MEWDNWPIYPCVGCGQTTCRPDCPAKCCDVVGFKPEEFKKPTMTGHCTKCGRKVVFNRVSNPTLAPSFPT